jgi:uncharacterized protein YdeI (YjbR/CyaY-like superfamily)
MFKVNHEPIPDELLEAFDQDPALKKHFMY